MSLLSRFANLWRRRALDRDFDDELRFHYEMRVDRNLQSGMHRREAEEEARRHLGPYRAKEGMRDARIIIWIDELGRDLRYGARRFGKEPLVTGLALLMLSLGIGANTVMFSLIYAVLFRPLPFADVDRLMVLADAFQLTGVSGAPVTVPEWIDVRSGTSAFEAMSFYDTRDVQLNGGTEPARALAGRVEATFLTTLGARAQFGRVFVDGESVPGRDHVVVLTDGLWRRTFGADPSIVGREISLNGAATTVVGILTPDFAFNYEVAEPIELFIPFTMSELYTSRAADFVNIRRVTAIARLRPGISIEEANVQVRGVSALIAQQYAKLYRRGDGQDLGFYMQVTPLQSAMTARGRPVLLMLFAAVTLVLLIACVNTAQFLMARAMERRPEVAIRIALGAGRARLVRQFLAEAMLLGGIAATFGALQANWLLAALIAILPGRTTESSAPRLDLPVLVFTAVLAVVATLLFGLLPSFRFARFASFRNVEQEQSGGKSRSRQALIALEVGISIVLLICAGLMIQSVQQLQNSPAGYSTDDVTVYRIRAFSIAAAGKHTGVLYQQYLDRVSQIPGVAAAAVTDGALPGARGNEFAIDGRPVDVTQGASYRIVSPDYFAALQIPLLQGRTFTSRDVVGRPPVAIINEEMARRYWPGDNPLGHRVKAGLGPRLAEMTIVGVVGNVRPVLFAGILPQIYVSSLQQSEPSVTMLVRARPGANVSAEAVKQAVWSVAPDQPLFDIRSMREMVAGQFGDTRAVGRLLSAFAVLGLLMSMLGIYMIVTYLTSRRSKEVALRRAIGAQTSDVLLLLTGQTMWWSLIGVAAGIPAAVAASNTLRNVLVGVTPLDPRTVVAAAAFYLIVVAIAVAAPVTRAMRLDPSKVLRAE